MTVLGFISPLNENYITLTRAAHLIARERDGTEPADIMDMFKYAIFTGEFERAECSIEGVAPNDDRNLPLLRIEAPSRNGFRSRLPLEARPMEYFGVRATTVADILCERDALPGRAADWAEFAESIREERVVTDALRALAHIPYSAFPTTGQAILGGVVLAKDKLRAWMMFKGYKLPTILRHEPPPADRSRPESEENSHAKAPRGRPPKRGWTRVEQLIREMHAANPATPLGTLAIDACKKAAAEDPTLDVPSWETVLRNMKAILSKSRSRTRTVH